MSPRLPGPRQRLVEEAGGGPDLQAFGEFGEAADLRCVEAKRPVLARSKPIAARWTLQLLEEAVVELKIVERAGRQHDRADAEKTLSKPHLKQQWVHPAGRQRRFVAAMEDVLEVYQRPYDRQRPLVCLDETSKQLIAETRVPIAAKPGRPGRHDYEYRRNGTANLFMMSFAPLEGWRHVKVTDRHTAMDYAQRSRNYPDTHFPVQCGPRRPGQPEHAQASFAGRFFPRRSPPARRTVRVALHTKTWSGSTWRN